MFERGITGLLICAGAVAACGEDSPAAKPASPPPSSVSSPAPSPAATASAAGDLLLRWRISGGLAGLGGPGSIPDFSLYGDGRAIVPVPGSQSALREYRLTEAAKQRLLAGARAAGLSRGRVVEEPNIADAQTLEIIFGPARTRITHPGGQQDPAVRFWKRLSPDAWAPGDQAGPARPYEPTRLALLAGQLGPETSPQNRPWPLKPLGEGTQSAGALCTIVTGKDLPTALKLARAARPGSVWRSDGKSYSLRFRPLLPDETGCKDLET